MSGPTRRILYATAQMKGIGIDDVLKKHVALFSDYQNEKQSGFMKALGEAKKHGYIECRGSNAVRLTTKGVSAVQSTGVTITPITSNAEAHVRIKGLKPMQRKHCEVFDALSDGRQMLRSVLAKKVGYDHEEKQGFKKVLSAMKSLKVLQYDAGSPVVQLADIAFPLGRDAVGGGGI
jgi:hypothetical protein